MVDAIHKNRRLSNREIAVRHRGQRHATYGEDRLNNLDTLAQSGQLAPLLNVGGDEARVYVDLRAPAGRIVHIAVMDKPPRLA